MTIDEIVKTLQEEVQALKKETHYLTRRCQRLSKAKVSDPKYPYDNWLLTRGISEAKNAKIMHVIVILKYRLAGRAIDLKRYKQSPFSGLLYHNNTPSFEEFKKIMIIILERGVPSSATAEELQIYENIKLENVDMVNDISNGHDKFLSELLNCLNIQEQGNYSEICTFLLNDLNKNQ